MCVAPWCDGMMGGVACCPVWVVSDPPCDVRTCAWVASGNSHVFYGCGTLAHAQHTRTPLHLAALASVPHGIALARVRVAFYKGAMLIISARDRSACARAFLCGLALNFVPSAAALGWCSGANRRKAQVVSELIASCRPCSSTWQAKRDLSESSTRAHRAAFGFCGHLLQLR